MNPENKIGMSERRPRNKKIITVVIFFIIILALIYVVGIEANRWWQARKEYIRMGLASDKFPFRMFTEKEVVEKGIWPVESEYYNSIPTRTTPEETYAIFRQALIDGDLDKAAECFVESQQEDWRKSLNEIREKNLLQEMINDLPIDIEIDKDLNKTALTSYEYVVEKNGKGYMHFMSFAKDLNGDWKIEDL